MTDKVQKIKDWISKEQEGLMDAQGNFEYPEHEGAYHILCNLDTYIDSLPEEPVRVWHNMDEVPIKGEVIVVQTKDTFYGLSVQKGGSTYKNRNKDRYVRWAYASDLLKLSNVQRTVKNWKEPVSEDLEAAAKDYAVIDEVLPNGKVMINFQVEKAFKAGAKWQFERAKEALLSEVLPCFMHG